MSVVRAEILQFANWMEAKLRRHDDDYVGWDGVSAAFLLTRMAEEIRELRKALRRGTPNAIRSEAADVANFAMMIADQADRLALELVPLDRP